MAEVKKNEAKFKTFDVAPIRVRIPVDGTTDAVKVSGTIESTSDNQVVDITLTHPDGKETDEMPARYAETERKNILKFEWQYGVNKNSNPGRYKVRCVLRENESQIRTGSFEVER